MDPNSTLYNAACIINNANHTYDWAGSAMKMVYVVNRSFLK